MKRLLLITSVALLLGGCTDPSSARRALASHGFTEVVITGYSWFGCDDRDTFHTGFTARGSNGETVRGVVCSGWFKGAAVRLF